MNKDLEKEYKELMTEDVPDLWGRIEAGLEPKKPTAKQVNFWRKNYVWGTAIAACICIAISVSVIHGQFRSDNMNMTNNGGAANGMYLQAPQAEMADGAGWYENEAAENYSPAEDNYMEDTNTGAGYEAGTTVDQDAKTAITCTVKAEVTEVSEEENGMTYTVKVVKSDYAGFSEEYIIKLYDEYFTDEELMEGETYLFDILVPFEDDETTKYIIIDIRYDWSENF